MGSSLRVVVILWAAAGIGVVAGSGMLSNIQNIIHAGYGAIRCQISTCCDDWGIIKNFTGLEHDLAKKLHGQHLVEKAILRHLRGHFQPHVPAKALVLSFHGPTGVGKNFVSRIIADNIYKDGVNSPFVHMISATREFPHEGMVPFYKDQLKAWVEGNMSRCGQSMFIFDEVDKLPAKLLDTIKPYMDYYEHLGGVDYRRATFIFLSNTGGTDIAKMLLERWKTGQSRESLQLSEVEDSVMKSAMNADNKHGLWHSQLISSHLITAYVPFLPLEKHHVRQCVLDYLWLKYKHHVKASHYQLVDEVLQELTFTPITEQVFSSTGCKRVAEKVDFVMTDDDHFSSRHSEL